MALFTFYQIFRFLDDNTLEFLARTQIGSVTYEPGATLSRGIVVGGIDFFDLVDSKMDVTVKKDDTHVINQIFI